MTFSTIGKKNFINIGMTNCQGLRNKHDEPLTIGLINENDILGVTETWLSDTDKITVPGYKFVPLNRKKQKGCSRGGIGIFVRNEIQEFIKFRMDLSTEIVIFCTIDKNCVSLPEDLILGIVYIPPNFHLGN